MDRDKGQLLTCFSAEVWLLVLDNVKNAKDFEGISNASSYFRTLLQPRATQALFPEVLQIMMQPQPQLLSPKDLLSCRRVCQAWKSGVETALHDPGFMLLSEGEQQERSDLLERNPWPRLYPRVRIRQGFESVADFQRFQQHFSTGHHQAGNPFFCHIVDLELTPIPEDIPRYLEACLEFLQTYGAHVRYASIDFDFRFSHEALYLQFYTTTLQQILARMPNLRVCGFTDHPPTSKRFPQLVNRAVETSPTPMPELKHLHKIHVEELAFSFLRALLQKNPQVSIVTDERTTQEQIKLYLEQMPNLKRLEVILGLESHFQEFQRATVACQLSTLHLEIEDKLLAKNGLGRLFSMLEAQFSGTLTELLVNGKPRITSKKLQASLTLRLPHLKKFTFIMLDNIIPLDFMLPLENTLEQLSVSAYGRYQPSQPEAPFDMERAAKKADRTVKLYQFWVELEKSNVWVLFPKLKLLRTEGKPGGVCVCKRDEWIAAQRK